MNTTPAGSPQRWLGPLLIVAAGSIAYCNSFSGVFVYDDLVSIVSNEKIRRLWPITEALRPPPDTPAAGRPLLNLTLAVNYALDGLNPRGFHAFNLGLHLGCGLLLFGIIRRTCLSSAIGPWQKGTGSEPSTLDAIKKNLPRGACPLLPRAANGLAATVALLWTVHPLQTESLMYLTQRTELLAGASYLLTLYAVIRADRSSRRWAWVLGAIAACALGILSKELLVTAPVMILLYQLVFGAAPIGKTLRRNWGLYLGLAATWIILARLMWSDPRGGTVGFGRGIDSLDYLRTQAGVIIHYLRLAVWPSPLIICYADWPLARTLADCWPQGLAVLTLLGATIVMLARRSWLGFAGAWFFGILAPTSSFVPIVTEVAAERRMYLPLASVVLLLVAAAWCTVDAAFRRWDAPTNARRLVGSAAVFILVSALAGGTILRNRDYHDAVALWQGVIAKRPRDAMACNALGTVLAIAGRQEEAVEAYRQALLLDPRQHQAQGNLGKSLSKLGRFAEAVDEYRQALLLGPDDANVRYSLALALEELGRLDEAIVAYREVLHPQPTRLMAQFGLALCLQKQGAMTEAADAYRAALAIDPRHADSRCNLGIALQKLGQAEEARAAFLEVLRLQPRHVAACFNYGLLLDSEGRSDEAIAQYRQALAVSPDYGPARTALDAAFAKQTRPIP